MKKRALSICLCLGITMVLFAGCGSADQKKASRENTEAVQETGTEALSRLIDKDTEEATEVAEVTETTEASETSDPAASVDASAEASASGNDAAASGSTAKADTNKSASKSGSKSDSTSGSASQASQPAAASGSGSAKADNTTQAAAPAQQTQQASSAQPAQPAAHEHHWEQYVKDTIDHPEVGHYETKVVQAAYDEPKYEEHNVCNKCGKDLGTDEWNIAIHYADEDCTGSYSLVPVQVGTIHHDAVTEQVYVVDQAAWTEQVYGYRCSCGATK